MPMVIFSRYITPIEYFFVRKNLHEEGPSVGHIQRLLGIWSLARKGNIELIQSTEVYLVSFRRTVESRFDEEKKGIFQPIRPLKIRG